MMSLHSLLRRSLLFALVLALLIAVTGGLFAAGLFTHPIPGNAPHGQHFVTGSTSSSGPGWVWHAFDVSGPRTGEPDLLAYSPTSGQYVLVITDHYQFNGANGTLPGAGDCWVSGYLRNASGATITGAVLTIADLDRDGQLDVFAYNPSTGATSRIYFRSFGGCDWTGAV